MNLLEKEALAREKGEEFEHADPEEVIAWAVGAFPKLTFACSFGAEDVVLVDMLQRISPSTDIFYLDTDFHFRETYETRDRLSERYNLEFVRVAPALFARRAGRAARGGAVGTRAESMLQYTESRAAHRHSRAIRCLDYRNSPRSGADPGERQEGRV